MLRDMYWHPGPNGSYKYVTRKKLKFAPHQNCSKPHSKALPYALPSEDLFPGYNAKTVVVTAKNAAGIRDWVYFGNDKHLYVYVL